MTSAFSWLKTDESAKSALVRILTDRPFVVFPPPLHRIPFRVGNIVEIVGPSPSAKTLILIQSAVNCILPKQWKGVHYGGLDRSVIFIDLECRFDVLSLARALKHRINGGNTGMKWCEDGYDKELFALCMRRFLYFRCYNSTDFLATLKTMHCKLKKEKETQSAATYMLMIDSIGAFYRMDHSLPSSSSSGSSDRKSLSIQSIAETAVQDIKSILLRHPMIVLVAKTAMFGNKRSTNEVIRNSGKFESTFDVQGQGNPTHREYMPSVWQSFVTHRILLQASDSNGKHKRHPTFSTEWVLPSLKLSDKFVVNDVWMVV